MRFLLIGPQEKMEVARSTILNRWGDSSFVLQKNGVEGLREIKGAQGFDVAILSSRLPDMPATILIDVARRRRIPSICVVGERSAMEAAKYLQVRAEADAYFSCPLGSVEFLARLNAVIRRCPKEEAPIKVGSLLVDPAKDAVFSDGKAIHLTPIEFRLLVSLAQGRDHVVSYCQISQEVWGEKKDGASGGDAGVLDKLKVHVQNLRGKLSRFGIEIWNKKREGYQLVALARS